MRTCVIIPAYNESKAIGSLISRIRLLGLEVIIIDDGSSDSTDKIAKESGALVMRNESNIGKGASLIKGYNFAVNKGYEALISMDGDGQHSSEDIMSFINKAEAEKSKIVIGNRMASTKQMPILRIITNRIMSVFISLITKQNIPDTQCGFRLIHKELLEKLDLSTSKYETESEILIKAARLGYKIDSIPIRTIYSGQKSQINPIIDTFRFFRFIILEFFGNVNMLKEKADL